MEKKSMANSAISYWKIATRWRNKPMTFTLKFAVVLAQLVLSKKGVQIIFAALSSSSVNAFPERKDVYIVLPSIRAVLTVPEAKPYEIQQWEQIRRTRPSDPRMLLCVASKGLIGGVFIFEAQVLEDGLSDKKISFTLEALCHMELDQQLCTALPILGVDEMVTRLRIILLLPVHQGYTL
nr:unnamed protein product [Callosobruchus analis]